MRDAEKMKALYASWEREVEDRGIEKGMEKGMEDLRKGLVRLYEARFRSSLPAELQATIEATDDQPTLSNWLVLFGVSTAEEIAEAVLAGNTSTQP